MNNLDEKISKKSYTSEIQFILPLGSQFSQESLFKGYFCSICENQGQTVGFIIISIG
jgi:hypothetical protein